MGATWTTLGNPSGSANTFNSQSTYVLPYTHPASGQILLIYMGDRWNFNGPGSVGNASYVWLPLLAPKSDDQGYRLHGLENGGDGAWRLGAFLEGGAPT